MNHFRFPYRSILLKSCFIFLFVIPVLQAQHDNIIIDETWSNFPNEPSIKLDPLNSNNMVAASNINNVYYSTDGGYTWTLDKLESPYGVWGDPAITVDTQGYFYFFHLSNPPGGNWIDRIVCQRTEDVGKTWNAGTFTGLNGSKAQDKEWPVVDRSNNAIYLTWTQFDEYGSSASSDSSHIMFSSSFDQGESWTPAIRINKIGGDCIDDDNTVEGAVPAVGPNGEIYVSWAGPEGIVFDRSTDQGKTWLKEDVFVSDFPGGWNYSIPGISRSNGLPITACDTSGLTYNGTIYINWTDQRNGEDDTDVWIVRSSDGGDTWSQPIRVNDDEEGKQQFFSWMDIDQSNGYIYIVFYDRRHHNDRQTDVYLARSTDGGLSFENYLISESPFVPNSGIFFGDYTNITVHNDVVRPIWTRLHDGKLKILTAIVDTDALSVNTNNIPYSHSIELDQNYPNPFRASTYISFKLHQSEILDLVIYNRNGDLVTYIFKNKAFEMGKHVLELNDELTGLDAGMYYYILRSSNGAFHQKKMIQID
jgi:Neuraminidase (sialidase)